MWLKTNRQTYPTMCSYTSGRNMQIHLVWNSDSTAFPWNHFFFYLEDINCLCFLIYHSLLMYSTLYSKITGNEKFKVEKLQSTTVFQEESGASSAHTPRWVWCGQSSCRPLRKAELPVHFFTWYISWNFSSVLAYEIS